MVINNFRWESFSMAPSWPKHLSQLTPAVGSLRVGSQDHLAAHPLRGADAARLTRKEQIAPMIGYIGYRTSFITMKSTWNPSEIVRFFFYVIDPYPIDFPSITWWYQLRGLSRPRRGKDVCHGSSLLDLMGDAWTYYGNTMGIDGIYILYKYII